MVCLLARRPHHHHRSPSPLRRAESKTLSLVVSGEKGKANLARILADKITRTVADTQKVAVTFPLASAVAEDILRTNYDSCKV